MTIIACSECAHEVSNQAAACPNCGAPIAAAAAKPKPRTKPRILGMVIVLAVLCLIAATLWYLPPNQLSALLGQFSRKAEHSVVAGQSVVAEHSVVAGHSVSAEHSMPAEHAVSAASMNAAIEPAFAERSARESDVGARPVYQITAEQLFQAYSANAVATQSRIGNSRIRITGTVAEIDEDTSGHPVVRLLTGHDDSAEMKLNDDQKAAAAELSKGQMVDVQCDRIQRDSNQRTIVTPQGSGCALVSVDAGSTQAYLAVFLPNEKGVAPVYIVGPMSKAACLSRGDSISAQLGEIRRDRIISKNCAATAHESIPSEGCRLSASMATIPDMPSAHLWRYDCAERAAAPRRATEAVTAKKKSAHSNAVADVAADTAAEAPAAAAESGFQSTENVPTAPTPPPARTEAALPAQPVLVAASAGALPSLQPSSAAAAPSNTLEKATPGIPAADVSSVATTTAPIPAPASIAPAPVLPPAAVPAPAPKVDGAAPAIPPDLVTVKAADPGAADRIAAYCNKVTASASDQASVAAGCRREEVAAWTRLVQNNEFPSMDEVTRRKCSESPFPDSYVAKESCAKYVLHVSR